MTYYVVKWKYRSLECDGYEHCEKWFKERARAEKFLHKIKEETRYLLNIYGPFGCYNPYVSMRIEEVILND